MGEIREESVRTVILDFDDLMDGNDPLSTLLWLKERDPGFKVTLFAIPSRCSEFLLEKYKACSDWICLGIHGWRHSRHECLAWTKEETQQKLELGLSVIPWASKVFKAPQWEICDEVYEGCKEAGFAVADHIKNIEIAPQGVSLYVYNKRLREDKFIRAHGHIQPWQWTGLTENPNESGVNPKYLYPKGIPYGTVMDAIASH